jgi:hypothetical protein
MTSPLGGFAPATPQKQNQNLSNEGKTKTSCALLLVGPEELCLRAGLWKTLAQTGYERVKLTHVLDAARWPVLKWPRMAGFEVATEAIGSPEADWFRAVEELKIGDK